ncbi:MAG TPA: cobalamin-binding protein [Ktedonobacteraceae bacterium]|nr:cobalamin-binding protein [Ktedonobacteraceae bacterium]
MRLVSLLASATEMIAALGCLDQLVARSHECDYPPDVLSLPVVSRVQIDTGASSAHIDAQIKQLAQSTPGTHDAAIKALSVYAIDVTLLQELRPDVIFTQTQCEVCAVSERDVMRAVEQLIGLQPRIVSLAPYRLDDVWEDVMRVGEALDRRTQAEQLVHSFHQRLNHLQELAMQHETRMRVGVLEWLDPLMGAGNWTPELVAIAGGENVFGEIGQHAPWLSWEELLIADPDILVLAPCGFTLERTMQDLPLLQGHPSWRSLRAVKDGRVYAIDGNAYINRSGPRLVESAEILSRILWGHLPEMRVDEGSWMHIV